MGTAPNGSDSPYAAVGIAVIFFVVALVVSLVVEWAVFGGDRLLLAVGTGAALGGAFTVLALALSRG